MPEINITTIIALFVGAGLTFVANYYWYNRKREDDERSLAAAQAAMRLRETAAEVADHLKDTATITAARLLELEQKIAIVQMENALLKKEVTPISTAMQKLLIARLTNDHTPEIDALLEKLGPPNTLTDAEMVELTDKLLATSQDSTAPNAERLAAEAMPIIIKIVQDELEGAYVEPALELVAVPQPQTEKETPA